MFRRLVLLFSALVGLVLAAPNLRAQSSCTGTLPSRLIVGQIARVTPGDPNNVRDQPNRGGRVVGQIPGDGVFAVLEGPTCADGFAWYRVDYRGQVIGWTVEGTSSTYFTEPITPPTTATPIPTATLTPTPTPIPPTLTPTPIPLPNNPFLSSGLVNVLAEGARARVTEGERLGVYSEPNPSASVLFGLDPWAIVTVTGQAVEAVGFRWWPVETEDGRTGWVYEGTTARAGFRPAIAPLCPPEHVEIARVAYLSERDSGAVNLYTADLAGESVCNLTYRTDAAPVAMMTDQITAFSPDGQRVAFVDGLIRDSYAGLTLQSIAADGSRIDRLAQGFLPSELVWSPDSTRLAMIGLLEGQANPQVWAVEADGSGLRTLTEANVVHSGVAWSPDGETLHYVARVLEDGDIVGTFNRIGFEVDIATVLLETDGLAVAALDPEDDTLAAIYNGTRGTLSVQELTGGDVLVEVDSLVDANIGLVWPDDTGIWLFSYPTEPLRVNMLNPDTLQPLQSFTLPLGVCAEQFYDVSYRVLPDADSGDVLMTTPYCIVRLNTADNTVEVLFDGTTETGLSAR